MQKKKLTKKSVLGQKPKSCRKQLLFATKLKLLKSSSKFYPPFLEGDATIFVAKSLGSRKCACMCAGTSCKKTLCPFSN